MLTEPAGLKADIRRASPKMTWHRGAQLRGTADEARLPAAGNGPVMTATATTATGVIPATSASTMKTRPETTVAMAAT